MGMGMGMGRGNGMGKLGLIWKINCFSLYMIIDKGKTNIYKQVKNIRNYNVKKYYKK